MNLVCVDDCSIQRDDDQGDLYSPNIKCSTHFNNYAHPTPTASKTYIDSVQSIQKTLSCLERSVHKTNKYEQKLALCRKTHGHSHDYNMKWWNDTDQSEETSYKCSHTKISPCSSKCALKKSGSWSTMSIVCLQYQYEELSKRYESLLQAYDSQCSAICVRDMRLAQWRQRANMMHTQLTHAHKSLLTVGEMYLTLKHKRNELKDWYEERLKRKKAILHDIVEVTTKEQLRFHAKLSYCMSAERNSDAALLLYEIRKCNLLFLENMRLKTIIEELLPGHVNWKK